jgi:hypothetical protein
MAATPDSLLEKHNPCRTRDKIMLSVNNTSISGTSTGVASVFAVVTSGSDSDSTTGVISPA